LLPVGEEPVSARPGSDLCQEPTRVDLRKGGSIEIACCGLADPPYIGLKGRCDRRRVGGGLENDVIRPSQTPGVSVERLVVPLARPPARNTAIRRLRRPSGLPFR
jgi:hypothetical protein